MSTPERITITLPKRTKNSIESLADVDGSSISETARDLITRGLFVDNFLNQGGTITFRGKDREFVLDRFTNNFMSGRVE